MTDYDKMVAMFMALGFNHRPYRDGIEYVLGNKEFSTTVDDNKVYGKWNNTKSIMIGSDEGYCGFFTTFYFDLDGTFKFHSVLE